jgi:hypothetical protein
MSEGGPPLTRAIADEPSNVEATLCLSTKVIVITEDRLELRVEDGIQKLSSTNAWVAPAGILATCLATLFTSDFKTFSWVTGGTLKGIFVAAGLASAVWLVWLLRRITGFGRREFMESIRRAGAQYSYAAPVACFETQGNQAAGSHDTEHNNTVVLRDYLERKLGSDRQSKRGKSAA